MLGNALTLLSGQISHGWSLDYLLLVHVCLDGNTMWVTNERNSEHDNDSARAMKIWNAATFIHNTICTCWYNKLTFLFFIASLGINLALGAYFWNSARCFRCTKSCMILKNPCSSDNGWCHPKAQWRSGYNLQFPLTSWLTCMILVILHGEGTRHGPEQKSAQAQSREKGTVHSTYNGCSLATNAKCRAQKWTCMTWPPRSLLCARL